MDGPKQSLQSGNNLSGPDRTVTYTAFDMAQTITASGHTVSFAYGPDRSRYRRIDTTGGSSKVTYYVGNVEIITQPNNSKEIKRYIAGIAVETFALSASEQILSTDLHYLLKDHLGSLHTVVDRDGNLIEDFSFDALGKRRTAMDWNGDVGSATLESLISLTTRGYTGHEMVDAVGIIHMNGRIYDPRLGRFLQADPFVQAAYYSQSLNRYSYVYNNPLNATDPSGHFVFTTALVWAFSSFVVAEIATDLGIPELATIANIAGCVYGNVAGCTGAAFGSTLGSGGSFADAVKAGLTAYISAQAFNAIGDHFASVSDVGTLNGATAFGSHGGQTLYLTSSQITQKIAAHALTGGVMSVLQGGKFGHGFVSAGVVASVSPGTSRLNGWQTADGISVQQVTASAIVGGTVSRITGGKFANGAMTGAFQSLFNEQARAQQNNLAHSVANEALVDEHLTLGEANSIWRSNNDPNFEVTVDASQLSVQQTSDFNENGISTGTVQGRDWLVHGSVTLSRDAQGNITLTRGQYDFQPHGSFWSRPVRNFETYGGFYVGSRAGLSVGTDFWINYSGSPNVSR